MIFSMCSMAVIDDSSTYNGVFILMNDNLRLNIGVYLWVTIEVIMWRGIIAFSTRVKSFLVIIRVITLWSYTILKLSNTHGTTILSITPVFQGVW